MNPHKNEDPANAHSGGDGEGDPVDIRPVSKLSRVEHDEYIAANGGCGRLEMR